MLTKMWRALMAQLNKVANYFWKADPIAQMQYEYDKSVEQLQEGQQGLVQYRALVERVTRQVKENQKQVTSFETSIKGALTAGKREVAGKFALELQKAKSQLAENNEQLTIHQTAYENTLKKIQHASGKLNELRERIKKYDADLKMSKAEAVVANIASTLNVNVNTDFGQIEQVMQDQINENRAKARVAADLSGNGMEEVERDSALQSGLAENALAEFELELGLVSAETAKPVVPEKKLGPALEEVVVMTNQAQAQQQ